jgi:peptidoglycan/LPS O-acetylase OafA/YrhL
MSAHPAVRSERSEDASAALGSGSTLDFEEFQALRRFPALDGLRAIAILLVFTAHPAYRHFWPALHGPNGVTIFFVLSGFLITTLMLREESRRGYVDLTAFYIRRLCRIYPLYIVVLLLYCLLILKLGLQPERRVRFLEELPYYSLGLPEHGLFVPHVVAPFDGAWSLGIEEKFYLLWPLALVLTASLAHSRRYALLTAIGAASIAAPFVTPYGIFLAPYVQIVFGCLAALLLHGRLTYDRMRLLGSYPALIALTVGCLNLQFVVPGTGLGRVLYAPYGAAICLLLMAVVTTRSPWIRWLWSTPMKVTATLSYALYLIHNFGLNFAEKLVPKGHGLPGSVASTAIGLTLAYACAYALDRAVEKPFIALGHRITGRRQAEPRERLSDLPAPQLP